MEPCLKAANELGFGVDVAAFANEFSNSRCMASIVAGLHGITCCRSSFVLVSRLWVVVVLDVVPVAVLAALDGGKTSFSCVALSLRTTFGCILGTVLTFSVELDSGLMMIDAN